MTRLPKRRSSSHSSFWGVGILGVVIIVVILAGRSVTESEADPTPAPTGDDGVVVGDDSYWDQFDEPGVFSYTDEEKQQLRAWGYTGDEIEAQVRWAAPTPLS